MAKHNILGEKGECLAQDYLINKGYQVLATNWRFKKLELDIIAYKSGVICFVEVKTRRNHIFGEPEQALTLQKQKNILLAAQEFIESQHVDADVRFDLITVIHSESEQRLVHYEDVFQPFLF